MAEKQHQYIGRYGEVIKDAKEYTELPFELIKLPREEKFKPKKDVLYIFGTGKGMNEGKKYGVLFEVSAKTKKKNGLYKTLSIFDTDLYGNPKWGTSEEYQFKDDVLHGKERRFVPDNYRVEDFYLWRNGEKQDISIRNFAAKKAHTLRKLLEEKTLVDAIKTGDPLKVKSALTKIATRGAHTPIKKAPLGKNELYRLKMKAEGKI